MKSVTTTRGMVRPSLYIFNYVLKKWLLRSIRENFESASNCLATFVCLCNIISHSARQVVNEINQCMWKCFINVVLQQFYSIK